MFAILILICAADTPAFTVENKVPPFTIENKAREPDPPGDPYKVADYGAFYQLVANGREGFFGVLVVGPVDHSPSYRPYCRVASGFGGLADGEWRCFPYKGGAAIEPLKGAGQSPRPFPAGTTPAITVPFVAGHSTSFPASGLRMAPTGTNARWTILGGGIKKCTSYG